MDEIRDLNQLRAAYAASPLADKVDALLATARPCIELRPGDGDPSTPGTTRIGGLPDLPPGTDWPRDEDGDPLRLVAQVNLAELPTVPGAPHTGLLSFFLEPELEIWGEADERDRWQVLYTEDPSTVVPTPDPDGLYEEYELPREGTPQRPRAWTSLAPWDYSEVERVLEGSDELGDAYGDISGAWWDGDESPEGEWEGPQHRFLGQPYQMQGNLQEHCAEEAREVGIESEETDWHLLLQLDGDEDQELFWGDGLVYFMIRDQDLAAFDFSKVWFAKHSL